MALVSAHREPPMPTRLVVDAPSDGGRVTAFFSQGVAHGHVTEWAPGRALAEPIDRYDVTDDPFHITRLGRAPTYGFRAERVADWLEIENTRWAATARSDGGTDLRRAIVVATLGASALFRLANSRRSSSEVRTASSRSSGSGSPKPPPPRTSSRPETGQARTNSSWELA